MDLHSGGQWTKQHSDMYLFHFLLSWPFALQAFMRIADCIQSLLMNCSGFSSKVCVPGLLSELRVRQQGIKLNPIHLLSRKASKQCMNLLWLKCKQSNVNAKKLNSNVTNYEMAFRVHSNIKVYLKWTKSLLIKRMSTHLKNAAYYFSIFVFQYFFVFQVFEFWKITTSIKHLLFWGI